MNRSTVPEPVRTKTGIGSLPIRENHTGPVPQNHTACPGCGGEIAITGRTFCRPSCKARHQWQQVRQQPRPLFTELETEL